MDITIMLPEISKLLQKERPVLIIVELTYIWEFY